MLRSINGQYHSYLRRCEQLCAANNTTNLFNAFFSESIMQEYEDNMNMAPWIRCPLFLLSIQHIITGQWRDRQEIIERAAIIVSQSRSDHNLLYLFSARASSLIFSNKPSFNSCRSSEKACTAAKFPLTGLI